VEPKNVTLNEVPLFEEFFGHVENLLCDSFEDQADLVGGFFGVTVLLFEVFEGLLDNELLLFIDVRQV